MKKCLYSWRKWVFLQKNKEVMCGEVGRVRVLGEKRRVFSAWFNAAMESVPVTLFAVKLERV